MSRVLIVDDSAPGMDGIAPLKAIRAVNPEARVAVISAIGRRDKTEDSFLAGARDFIIKPFVPDLGIDVITRAAGA